MNKQQATAVIERLISAERDLWGLVGEDTYIPYSGFDVIEREWSIRGVDEVLWIGEDDEHYNTEIYGTSVWEGEHYTIAVCYLNGSEHVFIFDNEMKREELREDDE